MIHAECHTWTGSAQILKYIMLFSTRTSVLNIYLATKVTGSYMMTPSVLNVDELLFHWLPVWNSWSICGSQSKPTYDKNP